MSPALHAELARVQHTRIVAGAVAAVLLLIGAFINPDQFFQSYLFGWLFWTSLSVGALAILMLHHLVSGGWGFMIQRLLEAAVRTIPVMALLFLPLLLGLDNLYIWARPAEVAKDHVLQHKAVYLNTSFFIARAALYFAAWIGFGWALLRWSAEVDRTGDPVYTRKLQLAGGPGLVVYALTLTFASVDWVMSLEPHWASTMYGVIFMVGSALSALALATAALARFSRFPPFAGTVATSHFHDLGNLLFAFVMLWAYVSFSQFLIVWSGNLPEETPWYIRRMSGGWEWIALTVIVFHFFVPFLLLLSRPIKRGPATLQKIALWIVFMRLLDLFWVMKPSFRPRGFHLHWMDIVAPVAFGGIWLTAFLWNLKAHPALPANDPRMIEALAAMEHH